VSALRTACTASTARLRSDVLVWALLATFVLGGSSVPFLRATVYQEAILWEGVFASAFVVLALRGLTARDGFSPRILVLMTIAAGCCLLTRVVMATGLYAGILALLVWQFGGEIVRNSRDAPAGPSHARRGAGFRMPSTGRFIAPLIILAVFASAAGFINYQRFGHPLAFANFSVQTHLPTSHGVHLAGLPALEEYGEFHPRRIPYGLMYYFAPVWFVHSDNGGFLFDDYRKKIDLIEPPPSSFVVTDPLLLMLAAAGFGALCRRNRMALSRPAAALIAAGLALPPVLLLMAFAMAFRYRMEFYPLFVFLTLIGAFGIKPEIAAPRPRSTLGLVLFAMVGIVASHLVLAIYKISPWGDLNPGDDLWEIYQTGIRRFLTRRL